MMSIRTVRSLTFLVPLSLAALLCLFGTSEARAQVDHLAMVNGPYSRVVDARRSDLVLLPALIAMDETPIGVDDIRTAAMIGPDSSLWSAASAWASAPAQVAALDALRRVTAETDERRAMVFAQPYGTRGVAPEMIQGRAYTELGDPPLLAGARFHYLEHVRHLWSLVHIEATRLLEAGKPAEAARLLVSMSYFGRQLSDRQFGQEVVVGLNVIRSCLERVRDVAYQDFRSQRLLSTNDLAGLIASMSITSGSYLNPDRIVFPPANKIAAEQLLERLYVPRGSVREEQFASTMARLRTADRPLRLFAEASRFESAGATQADWFETQKAINDVFNGWSTRWTLSPFDRLSSLPYAWDQLQHSRFAVITASTKDQSVLFLLRRLVELEAVGSRHALAVLGYFYELGVFPPDASSVRPRWLQAIEADPFNPSRERGRIPPLEFFVPIRDAYRANERTVPQPHRLNVFAPGGENFTQMLRDDQFIMYSVGRDGVRNFAEDVSNDINAVTGDYLIWPPMQSLYRVHLQQSGQLP